MSKLTKHVNDPVNYEWWVDVGLLRNKGLKILVLIRYVNMTMPYSHYDTNTFNTLVTNNYLNQYNTYTLENDPTK
jgi:hypothetical protein